MNRFLILVLFVLGLLGCEPSFDGDLADPLGPNGELIERFNQLQADLVPLGFDLSFQFDEKVSEVEYNAIIVTVIYGVFVTDDNFEPAIGEDCWIVKINRDTTSELLERERAVGVERWISTRTASSPEEYVVYEYFVDGRLIYRERSLRGPFWLKIYASPELIPEIISPVNLSVSDHVAVSDSPGYQDVSWVSLGDGFASRMPIWVYGGIWTIDDQLMPILIDGLVSFKNPKDGPLKREDFVFVQRFAPSSRYPTPNGTLFPVSEETSLDFLRYMRYESDGWYPDFDLDFFADTRFYLKMVKQPLQKTPLDQAWKLIDATRPLPKLPEGFVPDFPEFKTPF